MAKKRGRPKLYLNEKCRSLYMSPNRTDIRVIPYEQFLTWYENHDKVCEYCGLNEWKQRSYLILILKQREEVNVVEL